MENVFVRRQWERRKREERRGRESGVFGKYDNFGHHSQLCVRADVTMHHPAAGVVEVSLESQCPSSCEQSSVFESDFVAFFAIAKQHLEKLSVEVEGMFWPCEVAKSKGYGVALGKGEHRCFPMSFSVE